MPSADDVLLRLVIRGMDPAEVKRLADQTYGQLKAEASRHIDELARLHREKAAAMDEATKKRVDEEIKAQTKLVDNVAKLMRQQEIETNRARASFDRWLERLENITVVAQGAWGVIANGASTLKNVGEEIDKVTNIYGSLKGSIDAMREATAGEVADIDLITTKNRAFAKDLNLTDEQFGMVAAAADAFADSLGTNTKDALDQIIDGLATGRVKMLEHAGVVINTEKAYDDYAKKIGVASDKLSESGKKAAIAEAAMREMDKGVADAGGRVKDFAHEYEVLMAKFQNVHDHVFVWLGHKIVEFVDHLTINIPNGIKIMLAKVQDLLPGQSGNEQTAIANYLSEKAAAADADTTQAEAAKKRLAGNGSAYTIAPGANSSSSVQAGRKTSKSGSNILDQMARKARGDSYGLGQNNEDDIGGDITDLLAEQAVGKGTDWDKWIADQEKAVATAEEELKKFQEKTAKEVADRQAALGQTGERAGLFGVILWGTGGPEQTYEEMDAFHQHAVDTFGEMSGMIKGAAQAMSGALATAIGGAITHQAGWKTILHNQTHDILESLATQAGARAIFETASAFAFLATGDFPSAASSFTSAAMFGVLAAGAGLGASAIGKPGPNDLPTPNASVFQAGGPSSSGIGSRWGDDKQDGGDTPPPITININGIANEDTGKQVADALDAYFQKTGRTPASAGH